MAIALQYIRNPISTLCCGQAASMASLLLAAGEKGHRQSLPNSRIMMHQPSGGYQVHDLILISFIPKMSLVTQGRRPLEARYEASGQSREAMSLMQGQAVDIRIHAEEMRRMANRLYEIYSKHTGQPADVIGTSLPTPAECIVLRMSIIPR